MVLYLLLQFLFESNYDLINKIKGERSDCYFQCDLDSSFDYNEVSLVGCLRFCLFLGAVHSWKGPTYMDYRIAVFFLGNYPEQPGTIIEFNIEKGLISSKTLEFTGFIGQNKNVLPSGDFLKGYA